MSFSDWEQKSKDAKVSESLLWEYDLSRFDWYDMRTVVVPRVIERGWLKDSILQVGLLLE